MKEIALLFPGQGTQHIGMGKKYYDRYTVVKRTFEEAGDILGFDLATLCFQGDMDELTRTENAQPAILTASVAAFKVYMEEIGETPRLSAGHSLGEISALTCAGAIKFTDAVNIVRQRGRFMQESAALGTGGMCAVGGVDRKVIEDECLRVSTPENTVGISNINSPEQITISGHKAAIDIVSEKLKNMGAKVTSLKVSAPFHSPLMKEAAEKLNEELKKYEYYELKWPVISNVDALPYSGGSDIIHNLTVQVLKPVQWQATMEYLKRQEIRFAIELGPKSLLKSLVAQGTYGFTVFSYDRDEDVKALTNISTAKSQQSKKNTAHAPTVVTRCMAIAVCTKNQNWDNDEYNKGVIEPYRAIQQMQEEIEREDKEPTVEQMTKALEMLRSVFITKRTPVTEQMERFNQIFDETGTRRLFTDFNMPAEA